MAAREDLWPNRLNEGKSRRIGKEEKKEKKKGYPHTSYLFPDLNSLSVFLLASSADDGARLSGKKKKPRPATLSFHTLLHIYNATFMAREKEKKNAICFNPAAHYKPTKPFQTYCNNPCVLIDLTEFPAGFVPPPFSITKRNGKEQQQQEGIIYLFFFFSLEVQVLASLSLNPL